VAAACGGDRGASERSTTPPRSSQLLAPAAFAAALGEPETVALNVHVPDEGSIRRTDLSIPYSRLRERRGELPPLSTRLAVYCRSGRMSASAVRTLAGLGFRRVVELNGGMEAWAESGRRLLPPEA
jgi:rhodanese-related sulfurtransferase